MSKSFNITGLAGLDELYFPKEDILWSSPWWNLKENIELRLSIQKELHKEIGPKHPLWGLKPVVFAKCEANDDVVVHLKDGRFGCVHLTWQGKFDQFPDKYPSIKFFNNEFELQEFILDKVENYT